MRRACTPLSQPRSWCRRQIGITPSPYWLCGYVRSSEEQLEQDLLLTSVLTDVELFLFVLGALKAQGLVAGIDDIDFGPVGITHEVRSERDKGKEGILSLRCSSEN